MRLDDFFKIPPYGLNKNEKREMVLPEFKKLINYHYLNCIEYRNILSGLNINIDNIYDFSNVPYIPVRLFKEFDLLSVPKEDIKRVIKSSGTTSQISSKIYLDQETSILQQKALIHIVSDFLGKDRMPMLILDSSNVLRDKTAFSTRGAGILGFSTLGRSIEYALDENMSLNIEKVENFLSKHKGEKIYLFGFTYIIWEHFYKSLKLSSKRIDFSNATLIHGGGWKKLISEQVSPSKFNQLMFEVCGLEKIYQNYGMAEQTGSIFMECEHGYLHVSNFSEIFTRKTKDFSICDFGEKGILQVMSILPGSYIGHSLLTEDEGVIVGEDDCECGRKGKYFKILGRLKTAELRGCSDTYERND
ncbi:MAG: acyl-protein synthetase [Bacillota bacterium]